MPVQPVCCILATIQELKHYVRTSFGTSDSTLFNDSDTPFQGICQGNGAGSTIWVAVSTPLIEMMRSAGHGLKLEAPLTHVTDKFVGFAFVDDTYIVSRDLTSTNIATEEAYSHM